jgi:hypothetical protein
LRRRPERMVGRRHRRTFLGSPNGTVLGHPERTVGWTEDEACFLSVGRTGCRDRFGSEQCSFGRRVPDLVVWRVWGPALLGGPLEDWLLLGWWTGLEGGVDCNGSSWCRRLSFGSSLPRA